MCYFSLVAWPRSGGSIWRQLSFRQNISQPNSDQPNNHANDTKKYRYERVARCDGQYDRLHDHKDRNTATNPIEKVSKEISQEMP